jgi:Tol biopolymer transport system component
MIVETVAPIYPATASEMISGTLRWRRLVCFDRSPGHDRGAQWSPDGHSIAVLSDRKVANAEPKASEHEETQDIENAVAQVYVVSARGGEAFPVSFGDEDVHAFAWSADSHRIYFATRNEWTKKQKDEYQKEWSDVVQFRESERGDTVFIEVVSRCPHQGQRKSTGATAGPTTIAAIPYRIDQMAASPDGHLLAFATSSRSGRIESSEPYGIYVIDLPDGGAPRLVLHTPGPPDPWASSSDTWSLDSRQIFFSYGFGTPEGPIEFGQDPLHSARV